MRNVTIHTIFWAPRGFTFSGPPPGARLGYETVMQQFFTDVAHDSGSPTNVFSTLSQYGDRTGAPDPRIHYSVAADSIDVSDPYPGVRRQCASPSGVATCVTDLEIQREIDKVIAAQGGSARGLSNLWFVFLPPNVDTCILANACGTNAFGGYHSLSNLGHGPTIYATIPDPLIETTIGPGSDPQGNPDAEGVLDAVEEETIEAMSDPEGTGWMDPNGFEIGDKCNVGPEVGTPLGFAPNGSPFNQLINGDQYLLEMIWSNGVSGCVQGSAQTSSPLPLATVSLRQFSSSLRGNIGTATPRVPVRIQLLRAGTIVATATTRTRVGGLWGPVSLRASRTGATHGIGDDREEIDIEYGAHGPKPDVIQTGNGGDPFSQSGWTGWFDLDHGYAVRSRTILLAPCSQTGALGLFVGGVSTEPPVTQCGTESDVAVLATHPLSQRTPLSMSSEDNRAVSAANPNGALVKLNLALGEPNSVSAVDNSQVLFTPTGFPSCTADLQAQSVRCAGLVPGAAYVLARRRGHAAVRARADSAGVIHAFGFSRSRALVGGDVVGLSNAGGRTLTTLHVARLRVDIQGERTTVASGRCQPGDYYGTPLKAVPLGPGVGLPGVTSSGRICPASGNPTGFSTTAIEQTDDFSGGLTRTEVPSILGTSPASDATLYGPFTALAQAGLPGPHNSTIRAQVRVGLTITRSTGGPPQFRAVNVARAGGVRVGALSAGTYLAKWVLVDANGDTRTVRTQFVEAG